MNYTGPDITRLRYRLQGPGVPIPVAQGFSLIQTFQIRPEVYQPPFQRVSGLIPWSKAAGEGRGVKLTTHLHLAPRLRMSGAIPLLPLYGSMAWTGKASLFLLYLTHPNSDAQIPIYGPRQTITQDESTKTTQWKWKICRYKILNKTRYTRYV